MGKIVSSRDFVDKHVYRDSVNIKGKTVNRSMGRVRSVVFHPEANVCVGIMVHRPDAALMFHRPDMFVALDGLQLDGGIINVERSEDFVGKQAAKRLNIDLDRCVIWHGLAVVTKDQETLGYVGQVNFDSETGAVKEVVVFSGAAKDALLGKFVIPSELIRGFRWGVGDVIVFSQNEAGNEDDPNLRGGLVVAAQAKELATQGGMAAAAGKATAVAGNQVRKVKVKVKPKIDEGVAAAGKATTKGLYVAGRQVGRSKGMFAAFKDEFDKASKGK